MIIEKSSNSAKKTFSHSSTKFSLILVGVGLTVLPAYAFSILQSFIQSLDGQTEFVIDEMIVIGLFYLLFSIPYTIMLYYIFSRLLQSLNLADNSERIHQVGKYRKYFQKTYIPYIFVAASIFLFLYYSIIETMDANYFMVWVTTSLYLPGLFGPPAFYLMEYILDTKIAPIISENLTNDLEIFPTVSNNQKNLLVGVALLVGYMSYTINLILNNTRDPTEVDVIILGLLFLIAASSFIFAYRTTNPRMNDFQNHMIRSLSEDNIENLEVKSFDDIGNLVQIHNAIVSRLTSTLVITKSMANQITSSSQEMELVSREVETLSGEIAVTIQQISRGATTQSEYSTRAIENINTMSEVVDQSLNDIESTLSVIDDIAAQTNILALNAAIEAARAGEFGRGFAVVADNVRRLAEETRTNSADINQLTKQIVTNIASSVQELQETLQGFAAQSEEFSASSEEVAAATQEQSAAMHQLTQSSNRLNSFVEELVKAMNE